MPTKEEIEKASPAELIVMLHDGAIADLGRASDMSDDASVARVQHAKDIIAELDGSLRKDAKGPGANVVANLSALYAYMRERLDKAVEERDPAPVKEVAGLLGELRGSWRSITLDP